MLPITALVLGAMVRRVAVTGAGGQTGQLAFRKLLALPDEFQPIGIVRSAESKAALVKDGVPEASVKVADVTDCSAIATAMEGAPRAAYWRPSSQTACYPDLTDCLVVPLHRRMRCPDHWHVGKAGAIWRDGRGLRAPHIHVPQWQTRAGRLAGTEGSDRCGESLRARDPCDHLLIDGRHRPIKHGERGRRQTRSASHPPPSLSATLEACRARVVPGS